ncbi:ABC transporter [Sphingomonas metalli]|uniref:ABC transporter n=1 Tax=Sphingomonas metalli TaxID=1779358 RepID=A0A916WMV6_9SPHN|nr:ABC transporter ATP-binding protein [Sphingomonas metalli]GGB17382.1 ABC transporter [Sphingomonas metalli]
MALTLDRVTVCRGRHVVVEDVSLALMPGRVTVILGPNGAGKSSLLQAMAGLLTHQGDVTLDGVAVATMPARERARRIGYLPQDAIVHWDMRVDEVVTLGRLPHGDRDPDAIGIAMAATGVAGFADRPVGALSGGERSRVLLARVLAGTPQWMLVDEPLASLDPAHALDMLGRLRGIAAGGAGVVVVLHDLPQVALAADDVVLMKEGQVVAAGPCETVLTIESAAQLYGVDFADIKVGDRRLLVPVQRPS